MASMLTVPLLIGQVSMLMDRVTDVGMPGELICLRRFPAMTGLLFMLQANQLFWQLEAPMPVALSVKTKTALTDLLL